MKRSRHWIGVRVLIACSLLLTAWATIAPMHANGRSAAATPTTPITHVVIFMLENHNFLSEFGRFPGVQNAVSLPRASNPLPRDFDHSGPDFAAAVDGGKMDEFPARGHVQYTQADLPIWWHYAQQFGLSDNFYSSVATSSTPNHLAMIAAGQTGGVWATAASNGTCGAVQNEMVLSRNTAGREYFGYPCYNITSVPQLLANNGISWRYYSNVPTFDAPTYIRSLYGSPSDGLNPATFITDVQGGTLADVSWVMPSENDHPPAPVELAQNWVSQQINALMNSSYWPHTAIFVSWDDWGGFYDPVYPPQIDGLGMGARVPLIVISPYAKAGYLSHQESEFTSFARFIEANWNLPNLGQRDALASISDLSDFFDFSQTPRPPLILSQIPYQPGLLVPNIVAVGTTRAVNGAVIPEVAGPKDTYKYSVVYTLSGTPTVHNVTIDSTSYAMTNMGAVKGVKGGGVLYQYATKLSVGSHSFRFTFSTPSGTVTLPDNGVPFSGPEVHPFEAYGSKPKSPVLPGQTATYSVTYASPQNLPPTLAEVDVDGVPHAMSSSGGTNYTKGVTYTYSTSTLAAGEHYFRYRFDDGSGVATYEGTDNLNVTPVLLTGSGVSPSSGTAGTTFTFSTTYIDAAGSAPTQALLYVDQHPYTMTHVSGAYSSGALYQARVSLASGSHQFSFVFADPSSTWADPLGPAQYSGPSVSAPGTAPVALAGSGSGASGTASITTSAVAPVVLPPSHDEDPDYPLSVDLGG